MSYTYNLIIDSITNQTSNRVAKRSDGTFFPFALGNTDYQAFKTALQTGKNADGTAVSLEDVTGTAMTADQITTFLETLP